MKITSYSLDLNQTYEQTGYRKTSENLSFWDDRGKNGQNSDTVTLGGIPKAETYSVPSVPSVPQNSDDAAFAEGDIKLFVLKRLLERLFGAKFDLINSDDVKTDQSIPVVSDTVPVQTDATPVNEGESSVPQAQEREGWGFTYQSESIEYRKEQVTMAAKGEVTLEDGTVFSFEANLSLTSETYIRQSTSIKAGDALIDPLVLSADGKPALSGERVPFDINADGTDENIPSLMGNAGFLAFDRNGNGAIDDGSELFGPVSGNGFAELAQNDSDGNGWIDAGDPIYYMLKLWKKGQNGESLQDLASLNIGALMIGGIQTPLSLQGDNELLGKICESGLYISEDGKPGYIQELDIKQ